MRRAIVICDRVDSWINAGCRWALYATTAVLFAVLCANVLLRYAMGTSLSSAGELPELLFPWMVMAGVVMAAQQGAHIAIAWLTDKLPEPVRHGLALARGGILMVGYGVLAWAALSLLPVVHGELTNVLRVPGSVTFACMVLGLSLLVVTSFTQTLRLLAGEAAPTGLLGVHAEASTVN